MASALASSSQSLFFTTTTTSLSLAPRRRFAVSAKKADQEIDDSDSNSKFNPFRFNFAAISDAKSLIPVIGKSSPGLSSRSKDPGTVFVAGATGQAGVRIAQTLLRQGFSVRAGVPRLEAAQELALVASKYKFISDAELKRFNAVKCAFRDAESIASAIGNASKVAVTIGPCEYGPDSEFSISAALLVIEAAQLAGVDHVAIVYDGNNTPVSPNEVINAISSFFNNLFSQTVSVSELLEYVIATDVNFTFIRTSLTEDFSPESSYNLVVSAEGANASDFKVAKSRIACLVADVFSNTSVAENKIVDVFTSPSSPLRSTEEFFSAIPEDGRRKAYAEAAAKVKAEEQAKIAVEKASEAAASAKKLEVEVKKLEVEYARAASLAEEAKAKAAAAGTSVENLLVKAKSIGSGLSWDKFSSQLATAVQNVEIPKVQLATVRGQAKAQSLPSKKAVVKQSAQKSRVLKPKGKPEKPQAEARNLFGGLFKQETIYIDDV